MNNTSDFIIENGTLIRYTGSDNTAVVPDGIQKIGDEAFRGLSTLTCVVLPDGVTHIGAGAFEGCDHLTEVTIPDSMKDIGRWAFNGCRSLTHITLPARVTFICAWAFMGCSRLTVYWDGNSITETDAFDGVRGIVAPHVPLADLSFSQATAKRMAVRSFLCATDRYTDEGIRAEYVKYALTQRKKLLPEIFAEDLVPALAFYAGQKKITAANFDTEYLTPATAANAAECLAFLLEWSSKNISPDAADQQLEKELTKDPFNAADMKKLWSYKTRPDGTLMLTSYKGNERDIFVPERIGRKAVTALDNNLFSILAANGWEKPTERKRVMQQIRTIAIPDSVTSISDELCYGCIGLTEITLPDSITSIGYSAFRDCCKLTKIRIPDRVTSIGGWAFCGCRKLTDISIPDGVTKLSDGTFSECSALTDITILPHVTSIGKWIFCGHGNLTVHAAAGSPAEEYAKENGIAVVTE